MQSRGAHVLVVDDEADVRTLLAIVLRDAGYEVELACDGIEALEKMHAARPDLLLLDLMMPRLDGWGLLEQLRKERDPPQVVVVSGAGSFDAHRPPPPGVAAMIAKPFSFSALLGICAALRR